MNCCDFNKDLTKYKTKKTYKCNRISPKGKKKKFTVPRRFSRKRCIKGPVKGFTMRSSCAPYKFCKKTQIGGNHQLGFYKKKLKTCSKDPMTGWYRNGMCEKDNNDGGLHTVCARMDKKFLDYTKSKGNDLYSVVNPGQNWCLCERRWEEAFDNGYAPQVVLNATNFKVNPLIKKKILKNQEWLYNSKTKTGRSLFTNDNPIDTINIKFKTYYDQDDKELVTKLKKECELVLLNNR